MDQRDTDRHRDGCFKTVTRRAALTSATDGSMFDIARGMGQNPVNPLNATSAMGRGLNLQQIGESQYRLEDTRADEQLQHGTPDGQGNKGHRGT